MYGFCSLLVSIENFVFVLFQIYLNYYIFLSMWIVRIIIYLLDQYAHKRLCLTILDTLYRERFGQKHIENVVQGFVDII